MIAHVPNFDKFLFHVPYSIDVVQILVELVLLIHQHFYFQYFILICSEWLFQFLYIDKFNLNCID